MLGLTAKLDALPSFPFVTEGDPTVREIHRIVAAMGEPARDALAAQFQALVGYRLELAPVTIRRDVHDSVEAAAQQWLRATVALLKDVYGSSSPAVLTAYPELRFVLDTSPYFSEEIVGTRMVTTEPWDIVVAMDWLLERNVDGSLAVRILEGGAGCLGGLDWTSFVARAMADAWSSVAGFDRFEDGTAAVKKMIVESGRRASEAGGIAVNYQEQDLPGILGRSAMHPFRIWLEGGRTPLISSWNKHELEYVASEGYYFYRGQRVTSFWLQYSPSTLDPTMPTYRRVGAAYKTEYHLSHALPGFWHRYVFEGGHERWRVLNPLGCELACDKAVLACLPKLVRFYLNEEPLIASTEYELFIDKDGVVNADRIEEVFSNPERWVVKSRIDNSEGKGVFVGAFLANGAKRHGRSWSQLRDEVVKAPLLFTCQKFFKEQTIDMPGSGPRAFEIRSLAWTSDGQANSVGTPFVRSSPPGMTRTLTGQDTSSVIPVLVPRR
jgi:hypothetical protein